MDEQLASVYGLKDRCNDEVFYVGMSVDPYARYGEHIMIRVAKNAKEVRILDMRKDGVLPELIIFEQDIPRTKALEKEAYWIKHFSNLGVPLTNTMHYHPLCLGNKTYTIKGIGEILMIGERTIFRLIKSGDLKGFKAGREWRFEESDIDAYIQAQKAKTWKEATIPATDPDPLGESSESWWQKPEQKG